MKNKLLIASILILNACGGSPNSTDQKPATKGASENLPQCSLNQPVPLVADPLTQYIQYSDVVLDKPLIFKEGSTAVPSERLILSFYNIRYSTSMSGNDYKTGFVGYHIDDKITQSSIGFSDVYIGGFSIGGNIETNNEVTHYKTESHEDSLSPKFEMYTNGGQITSIMIVANGESYCVKSITPKK